MELEDTLVTLLETFDCGDGARFLSAWAGEDRIIGGTRVLWRSPFGDGGLPNGFRSRCPLSGDRATRLEGGEDGRSLSEGSYRFRVPLSAGLFSRVSLISLCAL